jgi:hypothetical protein
MAWFAFRFVRCICALVIGVSASLHFQNGRADDPSTGAQENSTVQVVETGIPGDFPIVDGGKTATIYVDAYDHAGVVRVADDLAADIQRICGQPAVVTLDDQSLAKNTIIVGTLEKSALIKRLISEGKIDPAAIQGKWESFFSQVVSKPLPGVENALVIVGSDKRGAIFGAYDLSQQIGVSPWYYWSDVPIRHRDALFVRSGKYIQGPPAVKYRGIFINDEAPALSGWVREKFGQAKQSQDPPVPSGIANMNHEFYAHVFELLLRLRGNYLWPAMWNNAFNEDDPENPKLADEYGIVMGTSHQEPMLRAQKEWDRRYRDHWNYYTETKKLQDFWREGITRNKDYESILTMGLRGANDTPMIPGGTPEQSAELLKQIIADQRQMISEVINPDPSKVPQLWCPYKEVLEYYDRLGLRVPDDVTLLWCDDNWGNIRRLPTPEERDRSGGAGVYYHFDYVGGPRNYKWINTSPLPKIWEQMNLALDYGADRIWIVNVGDIKPLELPMSFFLQFAWEGKRMTEEKMTEYARQWATQQFGPEHAAEIGDILSKYAKLTALRKPELLDPTTFSLVNYNEAENILAQYKALTDQAEKIDAQLPSDARDAFFELVLHPTKAAAQLTELYVAAAKNKLYAGQGRAATNDTAQQVRDLFKADQALSDYYNHDLAHGKWPHMMDQTHIGYTSWQQPNQNKMPEVQEIELPEAAALGVAVEGSTSAWPGEKDDAILPTFDAFNRQTRWIEVFNKGRAPLDFTATASEPWIVLTPSQGKVEQQQRVEVSIDWTKGPLAPGFAEGSVPLTGFVKIEGAGDSVTVKVSAFNLTEVTRDSLTGFVETNGCVSVEAAHYAKKSDASDARWEKIDDYGRSPSAMTIFATTAPSVTPPQNSPCLEYKMYLFDSGPVEVQAIIGSTLNFVPGRGLRYAISFDDNPPQIVDALTHNTQQDWERSVRDNVRVVKSKLKIDNPGYHTLKVWMVDPAIVLEKIVVDCGGMKSSYFGPPESYHNNPKSVDQ